MARGAVYQCKACQNEFEAHSAEEAAELHGLYDFAGDGHEFVDADDEPTSAVLVNAEGQRFTVTLDEETDTVTVAGPHGAVAVAVSALFDRPARNG